MVCPFGTANLARCCLRNHLTLQHTSTDGHCPEFALSLRTACMCVACQVESSIAGFTVRGTRRSRGESELCSVQQVPCSGIQEVSTGISMLNKILIFQPNAHLYFQYMFLSNICNMFRCVTYIVFREYLVISCTAASTVYCVLCVLHWLCCRRLIVRLYRFTVYLQWLKQCIY